MRTSTVAHTTHEMWSLRMNHTNRCPVWSIIWTFARIDCPENDENSKVIKVRAMFYFFSHVKSAFLMRALYAV